MSSEEFAIVMCPPVMDYPEAPKDISKCELIKCPKCQGDMWLSEKKNKMMKFAIAIQKEVILTCYRCLIRMVAEDPEKFKDVQQMRI